ncbi:hypothetical protein [Streptomyces griseorubiginosus]
MSSSHTAGIFSHAQYRHTYAPVSPVRVLDTRNGTGVSPAGDVREVDHSQCGRHPRHLGQRGGQRLLGEDRVEDPAINFIAGVPQGFGPEHALLCVLRAPLPSRVEW